MGMSHARELASKCQGVARQLSYNVNGPESAAKHLLREASYFIDSQIITVAKTRDGHRMRTARGQERYMTFREWLAYRILGGRTSIQINGGSEISRCDPDPAETSADKPTPPLGG